MIQMFYLIVLATQTQIGNYEPNSLREDLREEEISYQSNDEWADEDQASHLDIQYQVQVGPVTPVHYRGYYQGGGYYNNGPGAGYYGRGYSNSWGYYPPYRGYYSGHNPYPRGGYGYYGRGYGYGYGHRHHHGCRH